MNTMGHVQSKWRPKGVTLTLHGTHSVHISMKLRKNEIHLLYLQFVVIKILQNKRRRKVINRRVWLLHSTDVCMTLLQSNVTSASQLFHLYVTSLTHNVAWTSVVHRCMNLLGPKQVHLGNVLTIVNILFCTTQIQRMTPKQLNCSVTKEKFPVHFNIFTFSMHLLNNPIENYWGVI